MWTIILSADKKPVYIAYKTPFQLRSAAMRVQAFFKVTELKNNKTQRPSIKNNIVPFKTSAWEAIQKRNTHKRHL